jgi:hypothetical protein
MELKTDLAYSFLSKTKLYKATNWSETITEIT